MSLVKTASKNSKKKTMKASGFHIVSNGKDMNRANFIDGRAEALKSGRMASSYFSPGGNKEMAEKLKLNGARAKGVSNQMIQNNRTFGKESTSDIRIASNTIDKKLVGRKSNDFSSSKDRINRLASKIKPGTASPILKHRASQAGRLKDMPGVKNAAKLKPKEKFERLPTKAESIGRKIGYGAAEAANKAKGIFTNVIKKIR